MMFPDDSGKVYVPVNPLRTERRRESCARRPATISLSSRIKTLLTGMDPPEFSTPARHQKTAFLDAIDLSATDWRVKITDWHPKPPYPEALNRKIIPYLKEILP